MSALTIEQILDKSILSDADKKLWQDKLAQADDFIRTTFVELFSTDQDLLKLATKNMKEKIDAAGNPEKKKKIIESEKQILKQAWKK